VKRPFGLGLVLALLAGNLALGIALKSPCLAGDWSDGRQYQRLCYTDIVPLYGTEHLEGSRLPFLDPCPAGNGECDEYPVLTMWVMRAAAWAASSASGFFFANFVILAVAAFAVAVALYLAAGRRVLFFVLAPTLVIYATVNWDLVAVAFATVATLLYLRKREAWSGAMLGLGAAAKMYPAILAVPFVLGRFHERKPDRGIYLAWAAAGTWLVLNLPFALAARLGWLEFFTFNSRRGADWDSLWFVGCKLTTGDMWCPDKFTKWFNVASLVLFAVLAWLTWKLHDRRWPGFPRWTFGFPMLVLFLLANKVYSPQYGLWLLPWFALALPDWRLFAAFEAADVAVFVTRFSFFGTLTGVGGLPFWTFEVAILVRAVILLTCVVAWVVRRPVELPRPEPEPGAEHELGPDQPVAEPVA